MRKKDTFSKMRIYFESRYRGLLLQNHKNVSLTKKQNDILLLSNNFVSEKWLMLNIKHSCYLINTFIN